MLKLKAISEIESRIKPNTFVTLTVRQGIVNDAGSFIAGSHEAYDRAIGALVSQINLKIYGKRRWKKNKYKLHNLTTLERSPAGAWHIHACIRRPDHVSLSEFNAILFQCWQKSRWYMPHFEVADYKGNGVSYILKGGQDTILAKPTYF